MRRSARIALLSLVVTLLGVPAAAGAGSPPTADRPLIEPDLLYETFSPNGDGRQDTQKVAFTLRRAATVTVKVRLRGTGLVRGPVRMGRLSRGEHAWTWDGKDDRGRVVADDVYYVKLRAVRGDRRDTATMRVDIDTVLERGTLRTSRPTIHPRATAVLDHVQLVYLQSGWNPYEEEFFLDALPRTTLRILDSAGELVRRRTVRDQVRPVLAWYGRRADGSAVPAGDYTARLTVQDDVGNRSTHRRTVTVSHADLVEQTWTGTVAAADADGYLPFFGSCLGCGDYCGPVPSDRFPGGLSFRHPCTEDYLYAAQKFFAAEVPVRSAPVDTFRIQATGGPTEPGSDDTGSLGGTQIGPGDDTVTTPWRPVDLTYYPYLTLGPAVTWTFTTQDSSYDVASFTVEYRHYVPAE